MKKMDEFARELAALYGIETIEKPNVHQLTLEDGTVISAAHPDFFGKAFGLTTPKPERFYQKTATFTQTKVKNKYFYQFSPPKQSNPEPKKEQAGNYNYAMAA
ncbi:MAG: hypothetical protein RL329_1894 [Bacteroidota bacterium]|jgi:hypothetical protein